MKNEKNLVAYLALGAVCILWGTTYLGLRIGVTQFPPFLFSMIRFLSAGTILVGFMLTFGKAAWPDRQTVINQAICGLLMVTMGIKRCWICRGSHLQQRCCGDLLGNAHLDNPDQPGCEQR